MRSRSPGTSRSAPRSSRRAVGPALLLALLAASRLGCEEDPEPCGSVRAGACDIREGSCRTRTFCLVRSIYGEELDAPPEVRIISEEAYRLSLSEAAAPDTDVSSHLSAVFALLGLLRPGLTLNEAAFEENAENTLAFYSHESKDITVIDHGRALDPNMGVYTLAHEFVHALQDARVDLTGFYEARAESTDRLLAAQSLVEGEATLYADLAFLAIERIAPLGFDWDSLYDEQFDSLMEYVGASEAIFTAVEMAAPYIAGGRYATDLWVARGNRGVRELWSDPPAAMIDWMGGYGSAPASGTAAAWDDGPKAPDPPDDGFRDLYADRLGALGLFALLVGQGEAPSRAWEQALGWRDDRLWTFADFDSGRNAAVWLLRWSGAEAASAFVALAEGNDGGLDWKIWSDGQETAILVSDDPAALASWSYPAAEPLNAGRNARRFIALPRDLATTRSRR